MSSVINKSISVTKGQEYKVCIVDLKNEENFFHDVYVKANECVKEIEAINDSKEKTRSINNIIAFCGERGQGKTSAMLSFSNILSDDGKYYIMDTIDPTNLESSDNILMLILSCIFRDFKKKWKDSINDTNGRIEGHKNRILDLFQKAYHHISTIKSSASGKYDNTYDFDDIINTLDKYGDSTELREVFTELVREFLSFINSVDKEENTKGFFVVQIDDTDLNIERAYEIIEDIRKYLSIPNVIILMATKLEQLAKVIEQSYINNFRLLYDKNKISGSEISSMASKYLEKLIPETKRIYLPNLDMGDLSAQLPKIDYKNENRESIIKPGNIQEQIIALIYQKTGISFDIGNLNGIIHPIIPKTMRELVNFLAFLSNMDDVNTKKSDHTVRYANLNAFYHYFRTNWIESNLGNDDIERLNRIIDSKINITHTQTLLEIKDKINGLDDSVKNIRISDNGGNRFDTLPERINAIIANQAASNTYSYSLGNIMDALFVLDDKVRSYNMSNFTFAIKTVYTIKMMIYALNDFYTSKSENNNTFVLRFIGTDFIGKYCASAFFPSAVNTQINRGRFTINIEEYEKALLKEMKANYTNIDDVLKHTCLSEFAFKGYGNSDYNYSQQQSLNNTKFSTLYVNISYFFIRNIQKSDIKKNSNIFRFLNFENVFNLVTNQIKDKDTIKGEATIINFYKGFFDKFGKAGFETDISEKMSRDSIYFSVLDYCINSKNNNEVISETRRYTSLFTRNPAASNWIDTYNYFIDYANKSSHISEEYKNQIISIFEDELHKYKIEHSLSDNDNVNNDQKNELRKKLNIIYKDVCLKNKG